MTRKESDSHFVLVDNTVHIVMGGTRICSDKPDFNVKYDPSANLFATYCPVCQSKNRDE